MRDLQADLNCVTGPVGIMKIKELYAIAEHALNRAITAEAENAALRRSLTWAIGQIKDEDLESKHFCGCHVRPDLGYCDWCDNYGKAFGLSDWIEDKEGER